MRYLSFISLLILASCASPLKGLQDTRGNMNCLPKFRPVFTSALYNTQVNVIGKYLSGLLFIKTMPDSSIRMVFSNEMGFTFFDFEFGATDGFKVHSIIKQMNKKVVINTLRKDFELILMRNLETGSTAIKKKDSLTYYILKEANEFNYFITNNDCTELVRIEKASKRKTKLQLIMKNYNKGIPDTIGITHTNFNFTIGLKRLER